jgi:hypothetical protein
MPPAPSRLPRAGTSLKSVPHELRTSDAKEVVRKYLAVNHINSFFLTDDVPIEEVHFFLDFPFEIFN